jgi:hypothetical protein
MPTRSEPIQDWVAEAVTFYRAWGFFTKSAALSNSELADQLFQAWDSEYNDEFNRDISFDKQDIELFILRQDETRVWWADTECDVLEGNERYVEALQRWGEISRGAFQPTAVRERWASDEGPIEIEFMLDKQRHRIQPRYLDDYLDVGILHDINEIIRHTGVQFAVYEFFDQTAFILALTEREKQLLQAERGWRFADTGEL